MQVLQRLASTIKDCFYNMTFEEFGFEERIQKGIDEAGFKTPRPVQAQCFQLLIKDHRDVYAQSQTGTGKTAAFLITIFHHFKNEKTTKSKKALIVTPTRELALQIEKEAKLLGGHLNLTIGCFYGGVGYYQQEKLIKQGVDVIIGTPGRLLDFNYQKKLSFNNIGFLARSFFGLFTGAAENNACVYGCLGL